MPRQLGGVQAAAEHPWPACFASTRAPPCLPRCSWQVRLRLEAAGILIMDTPTGTTWKPGPRLHIAEEENAAAAAPAAV